jgi:hypothetical protein
LARGGGVIPVRCDPAHHRTETRYCYQFDPGWLRAYANYLENMLPDEDADGAHTRRVNAIHTLHQLESAYGCRAREGAS